VREAERRDRDYEVPVPGGPAFVMLVMVRTFLARMNRVVIMVRTLMVKVAMLRMVAMIFWRSRLKVQMGPFVSMMAMPNNRAVPLCIARIQQHLG
jgi:hypothetical protein